MDPGALREHFLVTDLFVSGEIRMTETGLERMIVGGAMPDRIVRMPDGFGEAREWGVINLGAPGAIRVEGEQWPLDYLDCLYIGAGARNIELAPCGSGQPVFYLAGCPAHRALPTVKIGRSEAVAETIGDVRNASRRTLHKCIHPGSVASCQLMLGFTQLEPGSVWNTVPPHTHAKRSEIYLYSGLEDGVAVHLMGEPERTRSLIVRDLQAVLSPSWSIHTAAGTNSYLFVWCMAGENQIFGDMDVVDLSRLC
jgi:4-deoxy-L-threo-5-hexosulose-uronate ketol-isomerase